MDLNLIEDPNLIPKPRDQVQIQTLEAVPFADGRRIRVDIHITPFAPHDRPSLQIITTRADGTEVASMEVVSTLQSSIRLTVHLREPGPTDGAYTIEARLFYETNEIQHTVTTQITLPDDITNLD
jgi:hypothetical protein